jgi:hypothetical protein
VEVEKESGEFELMARVGDVGPIAWEEIAVPVPVASRGPTRVRISFLADSWRIDRVGLASEVRPAQVESVPIKAVRGSDGLLDAAALAALASADTRYLETRPGQRFTLEFEDAAAGETQRALLLASQGYYTEWIRQDWVRNAAAGPQVFEPSRAVVGELLHRWRVEKDSLEQRFFSTSIPVR